MEDTLWVMANSKKSNSVNGLNPCSNGRYSLRLTIMEKKNVIEVLILVLMEDTLWELRLRFLYLSLFEVSLILKKASC